jgi:hypothetical protein
MRIRPAIFMLALLLVGIASACSSPTAPNPSPKACTDVIPWTC